MDTNSLKKRLKTFLLKLKGEDNYLTTETITVGLVVAVFIIAIVIMIFFPKSKLNPRNLMRDNKVIKISSTPILTPTSTPIPLPRGPREFGVSNRLNPQIRDLKISEFYPKKGEKQEITVRVIDQKNLKVTSVSLQYRSDSKIKNYSLKLVSGTPMDGEWAMSWIADDSLDNTYYLKLEAKNEKGESAVVTPTFR